CSTDSRLAECQKYPALWRELEDLIAFDVVDDPRVDNPDVAGGVELEAVRKHEHPLAEAAQELSGGIELQNGIDIRIGARVGTASLEHPDIALRVHVDRVGRPHGPARRHGHDVFNCTERVG